MQGYLFIVCMCVFVPVITLADCPSADLTGDCAVDMQDLTVFADQWLSSAAVIEEGFESGDFASNPWQHSGHAHWTIVSDTVYQGSYSAQSGTLSGGDSSGKTYSTLEITLNVSSEVVSFYRKATGESGCGYLIFSIDGIEQERWSGEQDWRQEIYTIMPGEHTFTWSYEEDEFTSGVSGSAWIDEIILGESCPSVDLTGDCMVDLGDWSKLASEWRGVVGPQDPGDPALLEMVQIPAGTFQMGDSFNEGSDEELPVHEVTLSSFHMGKYLITNGQYCQFLNSVLQQGLITITSGVAYKAGSGTDYPYFTTSSAASGLPEFGDHSYITFSNDTFTVRTKNGRDMRDDPLVMVSWYGAVAYCNWRSQQEGRQPCYNLTTWECDFSKDGYCLPTEAQWEYAARGGLSGKRFPWGNSIDHDQANYTANGSYFSYDTSSYSDWTFHPMWDDGTSPYTSPVGHFAPNGYGLYDMAGNVVEWCNDWHQADYYSYLSGPQYDPTGPETGDVRVLRGGSYGSDAYQCRIAFRRGDGWSPRRTSIFGFRVCRGVFEAKDMVQIPAGTFQMGNSNSFDEGWPSEHPVHTVTLSSFYMSKYESTNAQYCQFLNSALSQGLITVNHGTVYKSGSGTSYPYCAVYPHFPYGQINWNGSTFTVRTKGGRDMSNDPMVDVGWYGSVAYCNWRSQQEGLQQCYDLSTWECDFSKNGYRLPTEAQWEYAARGGLSGKRFPSGDTITHSEANYYSSRFYSYDTSPTRTCHPTWNDGIIPYTSPVGSLSPNGYGLYDIAGNVWEWCNDWYDSSYYGSSPQSNATGPTTGSYRVLRGGSWSNLPSSCRVAYRDGNYPNDCNYGFRVCR